MTDRDVPVPVQTAVLKVIHDSLTPIRFRISSLIEGHYSGFHSLLDRDLIIIGELHISSLVLDGFLKDLLDEAYEAQAEELYLLAEEITLITTMLKAIEGATRTPMSGLSLSVH